MPRPPLPETDLARISAWCDRQVPERFREEMRWEAHVRGRSVTICETRPPFPVTSGEWTHLGVAQLRWRGDSADWTLHWADRNSRWHEYHEGGRFSGTAAQLLAEIDDDPTAIFKG